MIQGLKHAPKFPHSQLEEMMQVLSQDVIWILYLSKQGLREWEQSQIEVISGQCEICGLRVLMIRGI